MILKHLTHIFQNVAIQHFSKLVFNDLFDLLLQIRLVPNSGKLAILILFLCEAAVKNIAIRYIFELSKMMQISFAGFFEIWIYTVLSSDVCVKHVIVFS